MDTDRTLYYESWEKYPLTPEEVKELNYPQVLGFSESLFLSLHESAWDAEEKILANVILKKVQGDIRNLQSTASFDLVYFDAFGPDCQPDLWSADVFRRIASLQNPGGLITTYSVKGWVRRNLQEAGYQVTKHPGPPGKREILLATKL